MICNITSNADKWQNLPNCWEIASSNFLFTCGCISCFWFFFLMLSNSYTMIVSIFTDKWRQLFAFSNLIQIKSSWGWHLEPHLLLSQTTYLILHFIVITGYKLISDTPLRNCSIKWLTWSGFSSCNAWPASLSTSNLDFFPRCLFYEKKNAQVAAIIHNYIEEKWKKQLNARPISASLAPTQQINRSSVVEYLSRTQMMISATAES